VPKAIRAPAVSESVSDGLVGVRCASRNAGRETPRRSCVSGEIHPASGYSGTELFGPPAGDRWRTGKGYAVAEDLTDTAVSVEAAAWEPSTPPASPPGYELMDQIGCGGMGVVYRARDTALDRDVAVKLLSESYPPDSPPAQRFLSEARITGQLQHPGIPAVHQVGTLADGRPFLAMKLI